MQVTKNMKIPSLYTRHPFLKECFNPLFSRGESNLTLIMFLLRAPSGCR